MDALDEEVRRRLARHHDPQRLRIPVVYHYYLSLLSLFIIIIIIIIGSLISLLAYHDYCCRVYGVGLAVGGLVRVRGWGT